MATTRHYADTLVPVSRSRDEIDRLLSRHKASAIRWTSAAYLIRLEFSWPWEGQELSFRIDLDIPRRLKGAMKDLSDNQREQETRRLMRVLVNHVKAKLLAVEEGIADMEREFLPYMLTAGEDRTAGEIAISQLMELKELGRVPSLHLLTEGQRHTHEHR